GVAVAELGQGVAFPAFSLPAVLGELDGVKAGGEGGEGAAGFDLGELVVVADEDDLGAVAPGVVEEPGELAGADHGRFVDDEDAAGREAGGVGPFEVGQESGQGGGGDAGAVLEFGGGPGGEGGAEHPVAGGLPGVAGGA